MTQATRTTGASTPATGSEATSPAPDAARTMDRLFNDLAGAFGLPAFGVGFLGGPPARGALADVRVEVAETDERYEIVAEVPGMSEDDIDVDLNRDVLTIKGEKTAGADQEQGRSYRVVERTYGRFQRSFRVPDTVDRESIDATFDNGLLTVRLPKRSDARTHQRKVDVKAA